MVKFITFLFTLAEHLFKWLFEFIEALFKLIPKKKHGYHSEFISQNTLLSFKEHGFCLTGQGNLSERNSYQNALIMGGTGTGKSSVTLIPSLLTMKGSFVVNDPSGELYLQTAGYLKQQGYAVKILHFSRPELSAGYNPLARANSSSDIQKISSMLVNNALGSGKDPFWNNMAISLIAMLISILKTQPEEYRNLYNVRHLLNSLAGNPKQVDALFSKFADEVLFSEYRSLIGGTDDKVLSGTISTAKSCLQIFVDTAVAKVTSKDSIDFSEFRNKPTVLYIQNSIATMRYVSPVSSIFFEQFFSHIFDSAPSPQGQGIFLLIDEASSLKIPSLQVSMSNVRKWRAGIMAVVQSYNQLVGQYGKEEAEAIRANCFSKLYFTGTSLDVAKNLEQELGRFEYKEKDKDGKDKNTVVRPLMTADEIRTMPKDRAILICGHYKPISAKLVPYYKQKELNERSLIQAPVVTSRLPDGLIPLLPLPYSDKHND